MNIFKYILLYTVLLSCKKTANNGPGITPQPPMKVMEYNTTIPIPNVRVDCYACTYVGLDCTGNTLISTGYTDNEGKYTLPEGRLGMSLKGIILSKEHYLNGEGGPGDRYMHPAGTIRMHLIREKIYSDTITFKYYETPTLNSGTGWYKYIIAPPLDTTVTIEVPGNKTYTVFWGVYYPKDCEGQVYCNPPYLAGTEVTDLRLQKFGDTLLTIRY